MRSGRANRELEGDKAGDSARQNARAQILAAAIAALMILQSALGLLFQGQYHDVDWIKATWFGNDWVTLLVAAPLLVVALLIARGGSVLGLLLWFGLIGYAVYNYAYYLFGAALNVFFLFYVVGFALSAVTLILALSHLEVAHVAACFRSTTPVRMIGAYLAFVGFGLASVWLSMWAAYAFTGRIKRSLRRYCSTSLPMRINPPLSPLL